MALPAPHLDDRRFQQFVDDAKRYIQQACPEWTDHNVSDPGVTLVEAVAHMADQLVYRLNRVPEKNHLAFLDLLGVTLFPPAAARAEITFRLSAPQPEPVVLPTGTEVSTGRTETEEAVVFATTADLTVVPCSLTHILRQEAGGTPEDRSQDLLGGEDVPAFSPCRASVICCCSGSRRPCRTACSSSIWTAGWTASVWTRADRRWCGRPGPGPRAGSGARSTRTRRVG